jgi:hypothetical protein
MREEGEGQDERRRNRDMSIGREMFTPLTKRLPHSSYLLVSSSSLIPHPLSFPPFIHDQF